MSQSTIPIVGTVVAVAICLIVAVYRLYARAGRAARAAMVAVLAAVVAGEVCVLAVYLPTADSSDGQLGLLPLAILFYGLCAVLVIRFVDYLWELFSRRCP